MAQGWCEGVTVPGTRFRAHPDRHQWQDSPDQKERNFTDFKAVGREISELSPLLSAGRSRRRARQVTFHRLSRESIHSAGVSVSAIVNPWSMALRVCFLRDYSTVSELVFFCGTLWVPAAAITRPTQIGLPPPPPPVSPCSSMKRKWQPQIRARVGYCTEICC
ncbi:hypothetical protein [Streptomyces sp. NPDC088400]|uniref:hypothetical protein n=1 Tax=Streptomyces sp. NPDC088400 TaxID=3365861 RepID=UPI0038048D60